MKYRPMEATKQEIKIEKHIEDMHPSHVAKGYFILQVGNLYYTFCKSISLSDGFREYKDAVESLNGKL